MIHQKTMGINLGFRCNFSCNHCLDSSDTNQGDGDLNPDDIISIGHALIKTVPNKLYFVGGETTLYINQINKIIALHPDPRNLCTIIRTNGWFAKSFDECANVLNLIPHLEEVQLSGDFFHSSGIKHSLDRAKYLEDFCFKMNLKFSLECAVSSDFERLKLSAEFSELKTKPNFIQVLPVGRATSNKVDYKYQNFNSEVLNKMCPNRGKVIYFGSRGFSTCCSMLTANGEKRFGFIYEKNIDNLYENSFIQAINNHSLSEVAKIFGVTINLNDLRAEHSNPCTMCSYIFEHFERRKCL